MFIIDYIFLSAFTISNELRLKELNLTRPPFTVGYNLCNSNSNSNFSLLVIRTQRVLSCLSSFYLLINFPGDWFSFQDILRLDCVFIGWTCFRPEDEQRSPAAASHRRSLIKQTFPLHTTPPITSPAFCTVTLLTTLSSFWPVLFSTDLISMLIKYLPCPATHYEL